MVTLSDLFRGAEADFAAGRYEPALRAYHAIVAASPRFARARFRVADVLLNFGDRERAKRVYRGLAWHYIKSGQPLLGLVVCKMLLALDPTFEDVLLILAELYSSESDRVADLELEPLAGLVEGPTPPISSSPLEGLKEEAAALAADTDAITHVPAKLPMIPLFSHLTEEAFIRVLGSLKLRRYADGELIIREGEVGDSFYMLADGVVVVSKSLGGADTVLAHLHQGAVFGEMALVSSSPRTATVKAKAEVALLSLSRSDLEGHAGELDAVTRALRKFTRSRFLANLAATSPLFQDLGRNERRELLKKFQARTVNRGDILIEEGEAGRGLYLVLRGEYEVAKRQGDRKLELARLKSGDVFGEMSLLRDAPTTATVSAGTAGEVLFLAKEPFQEAMALHPEVRSTLNRLTTERLKAHSPLAADRVATDDHEILV